MPKYLVIGNRGTLGTEFTNHINSNELIAADRSELDITNEDMVGNFFKTHKPEVVINCAAYTNVDGAESDPVTALLLNAGVLKTLSEECNEIGAKLIHFSTGMVFDGTNDSGYNEDSPTNPVNKYGETKLAGEKVIQESCKNFYIIRTQWLYGKPVNETAKKSFIEIMIDLGKSGKVKGVMDEIGKPTWSKDLVKASLSLIDSGEPNGIYHLINEGSASRLDWAKEIFKISNMQVEIEPVPGSSFPRPAKRPHYELLNNTKLPKLRSWQEALTEYLNS